MSLPPEALPLLAALAPAFARPTFRRFTRLLAAAILIQGRHTVANLLRTLGGLAPGRRTDYQRVLSRAPRSGTRLGCALARLIVDRLCPPGPVVLVGDDTVDGHPGRHVYGKARHRDPVRSSHAYTARRYGHRWVVLAVLVRFPWAARPRALPVLVDLYRSEEDDRRRGRPHRTPARLMCRLLRLLMMRLPGRRFVFVGDGGYGAHEMARFAHRHRERLALVSKLHPEANLFDPPPPYRGNGRPRVKGGRRPKPREAVEAARRRRRLAVGWYGGGARRVSVVTGAGHWYKAGGGLVPLRWVHVRDLEGTHRDEYFYATDPGLDPGRLVTHYAGRWSIECTFQEGRAPPPLRDAAGLVPPDGPAGGPVPVRALFRGVDAIPLAARVEAIGGRALAGQGRRDLLRRPAFGATLGLGRGRIATGRERVRPEETPRSVTRSPAISPRTGRIAAKDRNQSS